MNRLQQMAHLRFQIVQFEYFLYQMLELTCLNGLSQVGYNLFLFINITSIIVIHFTITSASLHCKSFDLGSTVYSNNKQKIQKHLYNNLNQITNIKMTEVDKWISMLKQCKYLDERSVRTLCNRVKELLFEESNVQETPSPTTICGDIHGQFYDVLELFNVGGELPETRYIFIGDFVDRGYNSVETIELLFCYKVKYPKEIILLRGNHESRQITTVYGFYDEIVKKYGSSAPWKYFNDTFDYLPLGALVDNTILCIHGGLSPEIKTIDQMRTIDRKMEIPHDGPFCDLMWSDPENIQAWAPNNRGAGWIFGNKVVRDFNFINDLQLIARAHQLVQEGFQFWFPPRNLVTIWSAPNYCYRCNNVASIMKVSENLAKQFYIFQSVPESNKSEHYKNILPYFL